MPDTDTQKVITDVSLEIKTEDIKEFCKENNLPFMMVVSTWRRIAASDPNIRLADVIYTIYQAKQNGLPPFGEFYSLIPREGGKGFSLCFRLDAAYYIINHHPEVVSGSLKWSWETSDGEIHDSKHPPQFEPGKIDTAMSCTFEALKKESKEPVTFTCVYAEWVSLGRDGPKFLWKKMPAHMLFKQTTKEWSRIHLGAALPYEDERQTIDVTPSNSTGLAAVPKQTAEEVAAKVGTTTAVVEQASEAGEKIGLSSEQTSAALEELKSVGVDPKVAAQEIEKEATKRGRKGKAHKSAAPAEEKKSEPEKPKVELKVFTGIITGVSPRKREGTNQTYHLVELDEKTNLFVWHHSMVDGIMDAMKRGVTVQFGCVERKKDDATFYDVEEFTLVQGAPASEPKAEEETPSTGSIDFGTGF